jgi:hypothetical protein
MPFPCHATNIQLTAGSWHGRGRVTACEQRGNGMVLCESSNSIGRLEVACWPPASVRLRAATTGSWQGRGRVVAWERHGLCESVFKTAGERHGMCESASIEPKHVSLNHTICIIKLSCADCHVVHYLKLLLAQRDGTRQNKDVYFWCNSSKRAWGFALTMFLYYTLRRTTVGRTPLDE